MYRLRTPAPAKADAHLDAHGVFWGVSGCHQDAYVPSGIFWETFLRFGTGHPARAICLERGGARTLWGFYGAGKPLWILNECSRRGRVGTARERGDTGGPQRLEDGSDTRKIAGDDRLS